MDAEKMFDAAIDAMYSISHEFKRREDIEQARAQASRTCGHCTLWMTRSCPLEGKQRGYPHMNVAACDKFDAKNSQIEAVKKLKELTKPDRIRWTLTHLSQIVKLSGLVTKEEMKEAFDAVLARGDQKEARDLAYVSSQIEGIRLHVLNLED